MADSAESAASDAAATDSGGARDATDAAVPRRRPRRAVRPADGPGPAAYEQAVQERRPKVRPRAEQTTDDTDAGWGESPEEAQRWRWIKEQRPPHWG